ncbi:lasso peptide biosynthesis B2 protein [Onishia taeanensis]
MKTLWRFVHLPWSRQALLVEAGGCLALAWLLVRAVPFRVWSPWLGTQAPGEVSIGRGQSAGRVRDISRAVSSIHVRLGCHFTCLMLATAVQWMLHRRRISSSLVLGTSTRLDAQQRLVLQAHAWVRVGEDVVLGDHDGRYTPVSSFVRPHGLTKRPAR